jgi:hypothetical protein
VEAALRDRQIRLQLVYLAEQPVCPLHRRPEAIPSYRCDSTLAGTTCVARAGSQTGHHKAMGGLTAAGSPQLHSLLRPASSPCRKSGWSAHHHCTAQSGWTRRCWARHAAALSQWLAPGWASRPGGRAAGGEVPTQSWRGLPLHVGAYASR